MWLYVPGLPEVEADASWNDYSPWLIISGKPGRRVQNWNGWKQRSWITDLLPAMNASGCSASAMDTEGSPSDLPNGVEPCVESSAMLTLPPCSLNECEKADSTTAPSGMMLKRSMAQRGVDEWMSSLPQSLAPISRPLDGSVVLMATIGSGLRSPASSVRWDPDSLSWKTSPTSVVKDYPPSYRVLPHSASMRNGRVCPQPKLEPPTSATGSGSSPGETWGAPVASDDQKSPEAHLAMKRRMGGGRTEATSLTVQSKMWSTPRASMNENRTTQNAPSHGTTHGFTLAGQVSAWPTPAAPDAKGQGFDNTNLVNSVGRHSEETTQAGNGGSVKADLSPFFVAALQGLPDNWLTHASTEVHWRCQMQAIEQRIDRLRADYRTALRADGKQTLNGTPLIVRLFGNTVTSPGGCWEFQGGRNVRTGHGQIDDGSGVIARAHRIAHELTRGPVPEDLCVCHHCDNPPCVNPEHLWLGTQLDNIADRTKKGRSRNQWTGPLGPPNGLGDALHLGGNGLVPQCAAAAIVGLAKRAERGTQK